MNVFWELEGADELKKALKKYEKGLIEELAKEIPKEAEQVLSEAIFEAPVLSGELAASGQVRTKRSKDRIRSVASFESHYAAAEHEGFHGGRKVNDPGQGFKFFERAFHRFEVGFIGRVGALLKAFLARQGK